MGNDDLYIREVRLLRTFLAHGALSQAQYDKSYAGLTEKMYPEGVPEAVRQTLERD